MRKYLILFFLVLISIFILIFITNNKFENQYRLTGTFVSQQLPFSTMVFDIDGNYTFYFFNGDSEDIKYTDSGTFVNKTESVYLISSKCLNDKEIKYYKNSVEIIINDIKYIFNKVSNIPTVIE